MKILKFEFRAKAALRSKQLAVERIRRDCRSGRPCDVNISVSAEKKVELLKELSKVIAGVLGKPESYMCVHMNTDQSIVFGGTTEPAGFAILKSIGGVGQTKENNNLAAKIFPVIEKHLGIPGNRLYVEFSNLEGVNIGCNGHVYG